MQSFGNFRFGLLILAVSLMIASAAYPESKRSSRENGFICGTGPSRQRAALAGARYQESALQERLRGRGPLRMLAAPAESTVQADIGDVAVIENDGTMITQANAFNLGGRALLFRPSAADAYRVSKTATVFSAGGSPVPLKDDDSSVQNLGFSFPFYGRSYTSVQLNSDGNLTFVLADTSSDARDIGRFSSGPPRIGPLFTDLDPSSAGTISVRNDPDGIAFIWSQVPKYGASQANNFSTKLFRDGSIEFAFGTVTSNDAVVGISPGGDSNGLSALDFAGELPTGDLRGTLAEVFSLTTEIVEAYVAKAFLKNHPDSFDQIILFLGFPFDLGGGAYAYEVNVKNDVSGIAMDVFDNSARWGSRGRLSSFVNMGSLDGFSRYPDDPNQVFLGTNSTISVLGQEAGHRFLVFTPWLDGGKSSTTILGRDLAHWSFFFNSFGSVMEGNLIRDTGEAGNRRFLTVAATNTFSLMDQYLMGLVDKESVSPSFLVESVTGTFKQASSNPSLGIAFGGTRRDITIDNIIGLNGERTPSVHQAPKTTRQTFVLLMPKGVQASVDQIAKVQRIRNAWVDFYNQQTGKRGWTITNLQEVPGTTPATILFPHFEGDAQRYTGIALANWGTVPADVVLTAYDNSGAQLGSSKPIINPRVLTLPPQSQMAVLAEQVHGIDFLAPRSGWIQARSTSSEVTGFFLDGNFSQTILTGATAADRAGTTLYFTRAQAGGNNTSGNPYSNLLEIVNPNPEPTNVVLKLFNPSGGLVTQTARTLPAMGRLSQDLRSAFQLSPIVDSGTVQVTSALPVIGYQSIDGGTTVYSLPAQKLSTANRLYSAQFVSGNVLGLRYFSEVNLVNTSDQNRTVQLLLVGDDGNPVNVPGNPATQTLSPGSQKRLRGHALFGLPDPLFASSAAVGSLTLVSDGSGVIGDILFGEAVSGRFMASMPLDDSPASEMILSQVAQGSGAGVKPYYTGIAIYNPNSTDVKVTVQVYSEQGEITGSATLPIGRGSRISKTLPEIVPSVTQQLRGYIRISATAPVIAYELFGDQEATFLASVPAQPITP
jgi:hypothetical protein